MYWSDWQPSTCGANCWCEAAQLGKWILEPVNSWSNLGYVLAGLFFILRSSHFYDNLNPLRSSMIFPRLYGGALIFLGVGSFFYHASQTFVGQWFDLMGMYFVSLFFFVFNLFRLQKMSLRSFLSFYLVALSGLGILLTLYPDCRRWVFGTILFSTFILTIFVNTKIKSILHQKFLWRALGYYLVGQCFWLLDKNRVWCLPTSWVNGHGLWHLMTCVSAISFYQYFNSEQPQRS